MGYKILINEERTVFVRIWDSGQAEMATRPDPGATWGPPIQLHWEKGE